MRFTKEIAFDGPLDDVRAMLLDRAFREKVAQEAGASAYDVSVDDRGDGTADAIVETRQPATDLPSVARKFTGDELVIRQTERWRSQTDGDLEVAIPGAPGSITGTVSLAESGGRTVQRVDADIKVKVPLVGGQVEKLIGRVLGSVLKLQERVGNDWLAGSR